MSRRFQFTDFLGLIAILVLVAAQFWFPNLGTDLNTDTWSNTVRGKRAFYLLARERAESVSRNHDSLESMFHQLRLQRTMFDEPLVCFLGPTRPPTDQEWEAILEWVFEGGNVLYATAAGTSEFQIPRVGISLGGDTEAEISEERDRRMFDLDLNITAEHSELEWREESTLVAPAAEPLLIFEGRLQAARKKWGGGQLVVVSGDSIFSNQYLAYEKNPLLAWRLMEAAGSIDQRGVMIDEYLNDSGTAKMLQILMEMPIRPLTLMALTLVAFYFWYRSHRFGPLVPESVEPRRNIVDHTDTLGNLLFTGGDGSHAIRSYLRKLVSDLGLKQHRGRERKVLEPIAVRMGVEVQELVTLFQEAAEATRSGQCERYHAAQLIKRLSEVRDSSLK